MTLAPCPGSIVELLPHKPPMVLLDEAVGYSATEISARAILGPDHPFATPRGVAGHILIELMAQACGVFVGAQAVARGQPVRPGFLLGSRNFSAARDWLAPGTEVEVGATLVFRDDSMAVFDCVVTEDAVEVASARLNVYQPPEGATILQGGGTE